LAPDAARIETVLIRRHDIFVSTALARFIEIARDQLAKPAAGIPVSERAGSVRRPRSPARTSRTKRRA
jgi:hypothetical protein